MSIVHKSPFDIRISGSTTAPDQKIILFLIIRIFFTKTINGANRNWAHFGDVHVRIIRRRICHRTILNGRFLLTFSKKYVFTNYFFLLIFQILYEKTVFILKIHYTSSENDGKFYVL